MQNAGFNSSSLSPRKADDCERSRAPVFPFLAFPSLAEVLLLQSRRLVGRVHETTGGLGPAWL